jgi:hypothetical protein
VTEGAIASRNRKQLVYGNAKPRTWGVEYREKGKMLLATKSLNVSCWGFIL